MEGPKLLGGIDGSRRSYSSVRISLLADGGSVPVRSVPSVPDATVSTAAKGSPVRADVRHAGVLEGDGSRRVERIGDERVDAEPVELDDAIERLLEQRGYR